jgi:hypothetical protein
VPLREWEEIQEMLRSWLLVAFVLSGSLQAALLPGSFDGYQKGPSAPLTLSDKQIWDEYSLKDSDQAQYRGAGRNFTITAYRFEDPTGAAAAFDWQKPPAAKPSRVANLAASYPGGELVVFGNYLLKIDGWQPSAEELAAIAKALPKVSRASLPLLRAYMPQSNRNLNSDRYIVGPQSLQLFESRIPQDAAAFHLSTEAATARYRSAAGEIQLTLFSYPTPQIARSQTPLFEKIPGAEVMRSGPLVGVALPTPGTTPPANFSQVSRALLSRIEYRPEFTWAESIPPYENPGKMILAIVALAGYLIGFCALAGLVIAALRIFGPKFGISIAGAPIQELDLREK